MDMGLRHGRELFLHQKRYDISLRNMWLSHGIPSFVARKLESELNNGGWETL
jgi:E3 ubiquitin-protein ligase UBR1